MSDTTPDSNPGEDFRRHMNDLRARGEQDPGIDVADLESSFTNTRDRIRMTYEATRSSFPESAADQLNNSRGGQPPAPRRHEGRGGPQNDAGLDR